MNVNSIHNWDISYKTARELQKTLAGRVQLVNLRSKPSTIAGADVAYSKQMGLSFGAAVLMAYPSLEVKCIYTHCEPTAWPYIPGLLSFREAPVLLSIFSRIKEKVDLVFVDGQGIAHPRGLGLASHLGLFLDLPVVGCAKSRLIGEYDVLDLQRGNRSPLIYHDNLVGYVLCTRDNVKPLFISSGNLITPEEACAYTLACCRGYRLPEPTRQADHQVALFKKKIVDEMDSPK
ncbi:endonuclease V, partial [bacterium]|nr:endonuclease V [bacterium]